MFHLTTSFKIIVRKIQCYVLIMTLFKPCKKQLNASCTCTLTLYLLSFIDLPDYFCYITAGVKIILKKRDQLYMPFIDWESRSLFNFAWLVLKSHYLHLVICGFTCCNGRHSKRTLPYIPCHMQDTTVSKFFFLHTISCFVFLKLSI